MVKKDTHFALRWALHLTATGIVIFGVLTLGIMPLWMLFRASYFAMALLKVCTFLEHRAYEKTRARTVVIEARVLGLFVSEQQFSYGPSHASKGALV